MSQKEDAFFIPRYKFSHIRMQELPLKRVTFENLTARQLERILRTQLFTRFSGSVFVTDYTTFEQEITSDALPDLHTLHQSMLPLGCYTEDGLQFLYNPYMRSYWTSEPAGERLEETMENRKAVVEDFYFNQGAEFLSPDAIDLQVEETYGIDPEANWVTIDLPYSVDGVPSALPQLVKELAMQEFVISCSKANQRQYEQFVQSYGVSYTLIPRPTKRWFRKGYKLKHHDMEINLCDASEQMISDFLHLIESPFFQELCHFKKTVAGRRVFLFFNNMRVEFEQALLCADTTSKERNSSGVTPD